MKYFILLNGGGLLWILKKINLQKIKKTNTGVVVAGILTASVLAYCGYKLINNSLKETKYESNPNKNV